MFHTTKNLLLFVGLLAFLVPNRTSAEIAQHKTCESVQVRLLNKSGFDDEIEKTAVTLNLARLCSSPTNIDLIRPRYVIICLGFNNKYFPDQSYVDQFMATSEKNQTFEVSIAYPKFKVITADLQKHQCFDKELEIVNPVGEVVEHTCELAKANVEDYTLVFDKNNKLSYLKDSKTMFLYRVCNSTGNTVKTVDLKNGLHSVIGCEGFYNKHIEGDKFYGVIADMSSDRFVPLILAQNPKNLTVEQLAPYNCNLMNISVSWMKGNTNESRYLTAHAVPQESKESDIVLTPGWTVKLGPKEMSDQKVWPVRHYREKPSRSVTVMANWLRIIPKEGYFAIINRHSVKEYVTVFYEKPSLDNPRLFPNHVNATLENPPAGEKHEEVQLFPGWSGELENAQGVEQKLVRFPDGLNPIKRPVVVYPGNRKFPEGKGLHGQVDLIYKQQNITIIYSDH